MVCRASASAASRLPIPSAASGSATPMSRSARNCRLLIRSSRPTATTVASRWLSCASCYRMTRDRDIDAAVCGSLQNFIGADGTRWGSAGQLQQLPRGGRAWLVCSCNRLGLTRRRRNGAPWRWRRLYPPQYGARQKAARPPKTKGRTEEGGLASSQADGGTAGGGISYRSAWANVTAGGILCWIFGMTSAQDGKLEERERGGQRRTRPVRSACPADGAGKWRERGGNFFPDLAFPQSQHLERSGLESSAKPGAGGRYYRQLLYGRNSPMPGKRPLIRRATSDWLEAETRAFVDDGLP